MEDIRGVTINSLLLRQLEERGWVEVIGHRETVGRPALYATTRRFLDDLGVDCLAELPAMDRLPEQLAMSDQLELVTNEPTDFKAAISQPEAHISNITEDLESIDVKSPEHDRQ